MLWEPLRRVYYLSFGHRLITRENVEVDGDFSLLSSSKERRGDCQRLGDDCVEGGGLIPYPGQLVVPSVHRKSVSPQQRR